jgi:hypothetical protein
MLKTLCIFFVRTFLLAQILLLKRVEHLIKQNQSPKIPLTAVPLEIYYPTHDSPGSFLTARVE